MAELRRAVTYEVQVRRGSRWVIHAHFDAYGRNRALAEAKAASLHSRSVRVVKEVYDPAVGIAQEFVVYRSRRPVRAPIGRDGRPTRRPFLRRGLDHILTTTPFIVKIVGGLLRGVARSPHWAIVPRALLGTVAAFFSAIMAVGILVYSLNGSVGATSQQGGDGLDVLLVIFSGIFIVGVLAMAFILTAGPGRQFPAFAWPRGVSPPRPRTSSVGVVSRPTPPTRAQQPRPMPTSVPAETPPSRLSRPADELRALLVRYLRQAIPPARGAFDLGDPHIRFGINLFVAGACEFLCRERDMDGLTTAAIMAAGFRAVGLETGRADHLAANYLEHLIANARNMAMFGHGRQAMLAHLAGRADAADMLWRALDGWTHPRSGADADGPVTIMVILMTGSGNAAGEHNGEPAGQIIRDHNRILERRLVEFGGKRVDHDAGGVMAVFMNELDAGRAGMAIRADFLEHLRQRPECGIGFGIGLDRGRSVAAGNALSGAPVDMAARIAGVAKPGQVLLSLAARDRLAEAVPNATFLPRGPLPLGGLDVAAPLYEAVVL
ncbi:MAG: hypothetical protein RBS99_01400 [Rhodospirillales bacterium]|jgi:adenylate cyclase|nr:hypothetical protein [Rhodospirillales bacterium]